MHDLLLPLSSSQKLPPLQNHNDDLLHLPLLDSFFVLIILAAYSCPVDFLTHRRTTEKAPLEQERLTTGTTDQWKHLEHLNFELTHN